MKPLVRTRLRGQALVMVSLAAFAMFGIIGLAVDLGWSFYLEKTAQTAADAAALAAVKAALDSAANLDSYHCIGGTVTCAAEPVECPSSGNLQAACLYAAANGFGGTTAQTVTVQAWDSSGPPTVSGCLPLVNHPPTAPCVNVRYWVTVRVSERVPQLFSALLGNTQGTVAARATAAVAESEVIGSLILLNRQNDVSPATGVGRNLTLGGSPRVRVPGGVLLASTGPRAGFISGSGRVESPFTYIRTGGSYEISGGGAWAATPTNRPDGSYYYDPMRGLGQPPIDPPSNYIPVPGGTLTTTQCPGWVCPPGVYYATTTSGGVTRASGSRIVVPNSADARFSASGNFNDYVFFGGLLIDRATVDFGPGRYVLAGVNNSDTAVFETTNNAYVTGGTSETSSAGRVFILTDSSYGGQLASTVAGIPHERMWTNLQFGPGLFKSGNNDKSRLTVYGLNKTSEYLPEELMPFGPIVIWQDQANSNVRYMSDGQIDISCGSLDSPCTNPTSPARELELHANQRTTFGGIVYQPRGAWTKIQAAPGYTGPLRIISGAMELQGSGDLTLASPSVPLTRFVAALVE